MTRLAGFALLIAACFNPLDNPEPGDRCSTYRTIDDCNADPACEASSCASCQHSPSFQACYAKGKAPPTGCPEIKCASPCSDRTDAASCTSTSGCEAAMCPGCNGQSYFAFCYDANDPPSLVCEQPFCPANECAMHITDADCVADPSCYSEYQDLGVCDCAGTDPGCCMGFVACLQGPPTCSSTPDCGLEPIECGAGFSPIVINGCAAACTHDAACAFPD